MYYVPSPEHAYDSIRYIMERVTFGRVLRGLHFFGASFIVVAAVIHMLRVVALGSYKKPREVTWITGVVLLLVILGFALTGYLLPWDQKAYWATTVTINIARSGPMGEYVAGLMQGRRRAGLADAAALVRRARLPAAGVADRLRDRASVPDAASRHFRRAEAGAWRAEAVLSVSRAQGHDRRRVGLRAAGDVCDRRSRRRSIRSPIRPTPATCRGPSGTS